MGILSSSALTDGETPCIREVTTIHQKAEWVGTAGLGDVVELLLAVVCIIDSRSETKTTGTGAICSTRTEILNLSSESKSGVRKKGAMKTGLVCQYCERNPRKGSERPRGA
jgi:hypothetical protein